MISSRDQYIYTSGPLDQIEIVGEVMPNSTRDPYPLRGEDMAFLAEAANERRFAASGQSFTPIPFVRKVGPTYSLVDLAFFNRTGFGQVLKPGGSLYFPDAGDYPDDPPGFTSCYEEAHGLPQSPVATSGSAKLLKSEVLKIFDNQRTVTRIYVPASRGVIVSDHPTQPFGGNYSDENASTHTLSGRDLGITNDARVEVPYGGADTIGTWNALQQMDYARSHGQISAGGEFVYWKWCLYSEISPAQASWASGRFEFALSDIPALCSVTPIIKFEFQEVNDALFWGGVGSFHEVHKYGYYPSMTKTAGQSRSNRLSWSLDEVIRTQAESLPYYERWKYRGDAPSPSEFKDPISKYLFDSITSIRMVVSLDGFVIDFGDRTKWWS